jgi:hypothetical protein
MTGLQEFQRSMARAVMQPMSLRDGLKKRGAKDGIALVKANSRLSSLERLEIYSRSYWFRILEAFGDDFPGVRALIGAKRFERLRRSYLAECPSESFTMRNLGQHLVAWMERNSTLVGANYEIALDMAKLEWAEIESFDAAEHERLSPTDVAELEPDSTLRLQPHLRLVETGHEVEALLLEIRESANRNGGVPRAVSQRRIARASLSIPVYIAIHRSELVVHYKRLDAEMFRLVSALANGVSIANAVGYAYSESTLTTEQCQGHIQDTFALFSALGWFCKPTPASQEQHDFEHNHSHIR